MEAAALMMRSRGAHSVRLVDESGGPAVRILCGVVALGLGAYAAHSLLGLGGGGMDGIFEDWGFNGLLFASAALCLLRAARSPVERGAWTALGVGLGCWALGEVVFTLDPSQVTEGS